MVDEVRRAEPRTALRRIERLLRVLVIGGAALAASCATVPKSGDGSAASGSESKGKEKPQTEGEKDPGSGVRGW